MKWTDQQREAIEYRNNNVLLAAAAGSGKTAVLVQRVIEMIEKDKVSVNELLVLTFTDAAASEMREKIKNAIEKLYKEDYELFYYTTDDTIIYERTLSFRLGMYLQKLFNDYNVDCEYNRHIDMIKTLKKDRIYPDIIIHKRKTDNNNLL